MKYRLKINLISKKRAPSRSSLSFCMNQSYAVWKTSLSDTLESERDEIET
jgi:hypothetical protein